MRLNHSFAYAGNTAEGDSVPLNVAYYTDPADEFSRPADIEIEGVYAAEDVTLATCCVKKGEPMPPGWLTEHYDDIRCDCINRLLAE